MYTAAELQSIKIETLEDGHKFVADIDERRSDLLFQMQQEGSIPQHRELSDERYELKKAKSAIRSQMAKLVRSRRDARAAEAGREQAKDGQT